MADAGVARHRFEVLDALRGLCAVGVVSLHFCEAYGKPAWLPHSHLAVEYFLLLTGFTFIAAYDRRWADGTLTLGGFLWRRFMRLWPLVLVGSFIGLIFRFVMGAQFTTVSRSIVPDPLSDCGLFLYTLTMLPAPKAWGFLQPLQAQTWTLFYIIWVNALYGLFLRRFRTWMLAVGTTLGAGYSLYVLVQCHSYALGWDWMPNHIMTASARVVFPVFLGMLIARKGWKLSFPGAGLVSALLAATIVFGPFCTADRSVPFAVYEGIAVFAVLPLVVLTGAGGGIPEGRFAAFCRFMGRYSFPLYATHFPVRIALGVWRRSAPVDAPWTHHAALIFSATVISLALAWLAMKAADGISNMLARVRGDGV